MKTLHKVLFGLLAVIISLTACDPNKELYEQLDAMQKPYNKAVQYTVTAADYNSVGGAVRTYQAFNATAPAKDYMPAILARNYIALNLKSSALVTYNYMEVDTVRAWEKVVFGYTLTNDDYAATGNFFISSYKYFWNASGYNSYDHIPALLPNIYPNAQEEEVVAIIYNFNTGTTVVVHADNYQFNGTEWVYLNTITDMAEADYILTSDDYLSMGFSSLRFPNLSSADRYIPIWLKIKFPFAYSGDSYILQYAYGSETSTNIASQYSFNGEEWIKAIGYEIEIRSEQYVYALSGWVFDPTIRFIMTKSDYTIIAMNDPIPHPRFVDQGYYFGASGFYGNFDMRLIAFHLRVYTWGENAYDPEVDDPELVEIYNTLGPEAATEELYRRIVQEGLIILLENKFPDAQPQVGGVDSHFVVGFETYNDNLSRSYLEAEYRCVAPASGENPPVFEFVDGPRPRQ